MYAKGLGVLKDSSKAKELYIQAYTLRDTNLNYTLESGFSEGLAGVKLNGKYGLINKSGRFVVKPKFDFLGNFHEAFALVHINGKVGFINKNREFLVEPKFDAAS